MHFQIDNDVFTLAEMMEANADDKHAIEWLQNAKIGDVFDDVNSERVVCVE